VVGRDAVPFKSLVFVQIPGSGFLFVASNRDLSELRDEHTLEVEGAYGGLHGPGWLEPVIFATSVEPTS
jgi:hypothetical protein